MYKCFRFVVIIEEKNEFQDEMIDWFGNYLKEVEYLFIVVEMKVYVKYECVELIKQDKDVVRLMIFEEVSVEIDGQKLFEFGNKYGR